MKKTGESHEPYYDLFEDFDLIVSSFLAQYGIRILSPDLKTMSWDEFKALLSGIGPDTPLGRIVTIRAETDKEIIKNFTKDQHKIWSEWRSRQAENTSQEATDEFLRMMLDGFKAMAGVIDEK